MQHKHATSDPQDELFEVLDEHGQPTGERKARGLVHHDGDWHAALHIWVGGIDARGVPFVLLQRRSLTKDTSPGALDVTVGGHIRAGETLTDAVRESEEEIGLRLTMADLTRVGTRYAVVPGDGYIDREVQAVFLYRSDLLPKQYRLHPDEIDALVTIPIADARRLFSREVDTISACEYVRGARASNEIQIHRHDMAGGGDNHYPLVVLDAMLAAFAGHRAEPVVLHWTAPSSGGT